MELFLSYFSARKNKRNTHNQSKFEKRLIRNLVSLWKEILYGKYTIQRSIAFIIFDPVQREIFAASFRDRIVHHLLYRWLQPIFLPRFIHDTYSCIEGRGTDFAVARLEKHIRSVSQNYSKECWVLKLDLKGYFMAINRRILYDIIVDTVERTGNDHRPSWPLIKYLLKKVIFNDPTKGCRIKGRRRDWDGLPKDKSLFYSAPGCGLPIGNVTSLLFSNIYLDRLDQYCKRTLKCRHYGRYVDDFYMVDTSRERLLSYIQPIRLFLKTELGITLHPRKVWLHRQEEGVPFLGAVLSNGKRRMSPRARKKMSRRLTEAYCFGNDPYVVRAVENSYKGLSKKFNAGKNVWYGARKEKRPKISPRTRNA